MPSVLNDAKTTERDTRKNRLCVHSQNVRQALAIMQSHSHPLDLPQFKVNTTPGHAPQSLRCAEMP